MPLGVGNEWTYEVSSSPTAPPRVATLEVLENTERDGGLFARIRRTIGDSVTTIEAMCDSDGTEFLAMFVPLGPPLPSKLGYAPTVTERQGRLIPPLSSFERGAQWDHFLTARTTRPAGRAMTMDSIWSVHGRWARTRQVTVPAGRYDVVDVELEVTVHHRPPEEEDVVLTDRMMDPPPMGFTYAIAPGVGVVLIEGVPQPERPSRRARWALTGVRSASQPTKSASQPTH